MTASMFAVGEALGTELLLDTAIDAHGHDTIHVARPRAERQPVEDVRSLLARRSSRLPAATRNVRKVSRRSKPILRATTARHYSQRTGSSHGKPPPSVLVKGDATTLGGR